MSEGYSTTSPQKQKSAFQKVNQECAQFREQIINLKNQKANLGQTIKKYENQLKVYEVKYNSIQAQLQKQRTENHKFIQQLQKQKKQKAQIVTNHQNVLNSMSRDQIELSKMTSQNKTLKEQNEKLEKQFQTQQVDRVNYIKDKQNTTNKITLLETKLQAATMELKFVKIKSTQLQTENVRLRSEVATLQKSLAQKQGPLKVQTIYKDQTSTKQKLLNQFQERIKDKQQVMRQQIQKHELKNEELTQKVAYLEAQLRLVK